MKALTSPSCRVGLDSYRERGSSSSLMESFFLRNRVKVSGFGFLNSSNVKQSNKPLYPVSCVSPKPQVDLESENVQTEGIYESKTVHVKFQLQKECMFGEHFFIVGDDPIFGLWDPESAVPLNWSDGHVWNVELDIPVGKSIQFKIILKDRTGEVLWQPGPDRVFQTWETKNTITIHEDWENAELQIITEEEQVPLQNVAEILTHPQEQMVFDVNNESATANDDVNPAAKPLIEPHATANDDVNPAEKPLIEPHATANDDVNPAEKPLIEPHKEQIVSNNIPPPEEKPKAVDADNISYINHDPVVSFSPEVPNEKRINSTNEDFTATSKNNIVVAEDILGNNGRVASDNNVTSTIVDANLFNYKGDPVLVPGLTPSPTESTKEVNQDQVENILSFDESIEAKDAKEAKDYNLPEIQLDEEKEPHSNPSETGTVSEMFDGEEEKLENELQQKPQFAKTEEESDSELEDCNVLNNDLQWGRKTLEKFLTNFGLF